MLFIYRVINNLSPELISERKRLQNILYVQSPPFNYRKYARVVFQGSLLWNNLPNSYKDINTKFTFKENIKQWKPTKSCGRVSLCFSNVVRITFI